jgi:phospholipid-binding lipoprotein MlaA
MTRVLFRIHEALDVVIFRPAAMTYVRLVPPIIRHVLHNAVVNLGEPRTAVNDALQGRAVRTLKSVVRFSLNTTMGLAGLFDVAARGGLPAQPNDFGITLAHLGVGSGPYLFIPFYGPTTLRDLSGDVADLGLNPLTYARYTGDTEVGVASVVSEGFYQRAAADGDLKALEASATDLYASFRSYYLQNREATITGGRIDLKTLPDFGDDAPAPDAAAPTAQPSGDEMKRPAAPAPTAESAAASAPGLAPPSIAPASPPA